MRTYIPTKDNEKSISPISTRGNKRDQSVKNLRERRSNNSVEFFGQIQHTFVRVGLDGASNFATPHDLRFRGAGRGASQRHVAPFPHLHIRAGGVVQDIRWYWNNDHIATTTSSPPPSCTERQPRVTTGTLERGRHSLGWMAIWPKSAPIYQCLVVYSQIFHTTRGHSTQFDRKIREWSLGWSNE